jgi:pyruvate/2-oxoglutarate dehydrogenase complex dihydrolipoamide acyltransferase (E2) component
MTRMIHAVVRVPRAGVGVVRDGHHHAVQVGVRVKVDDHLVVEVIQGGERMVVVEEERRCQRLRNRRCSYRHTVERNSWCNFVFHTIETMQDYVS